MKWVVLELREYEVEAPSLEACEAEMGEHGPEISVEEPVKDCGLLVPLMCRMAEVED